MSIDSYNVFIFTLMFVVPGFLLRSTLSFLMALKPRPGQAEDEPEHLALIRSLMVSAVYLTVVGTPVYFAFLGDVDSKQEFVDYLADYTGFSIAMWFLLVVVGPIVSALALWYVSTTKTFKPVFRRLGITYPLPHHIDSAWADKFHRIREGGHGIWILVTLSDGSKIGGYYRSPSFAAETGEHRDIYIHETYEIMESGQFRKPAIASSVLINGTEIRHIFFLEQ